MWRVWTGYYCIHDLVDNKNYKNCMSLITISYYGHKDEYKYDEFDDNPPIFHHLNWFSSYETWTLILIGAFCLQMCAQKHSSTQSINHTLSMENVLSKLSNTNEWWNTSFLFIKYWYRKYTYKIVVNLKLHNKEIIVLGALALIKKTNVQLMTMLRWSSFV